MLTKQGAGRDMIGIRQGRDHKGCILLQPCYPCSTIKKMIC
ncbi:MAG: hypothetical protein OEW33_02090 [Nitrospirota bacterium]|nr:hypothetical protein [Nitrospirota bacterium]MDH4359514.1 hypothetical protein [Nitrospirota bacterium]